MMSVVHDVGAGLLPHTGQVGCDWSSCSRDWTLTLTMTLTLTLLDDLDLAA